MIINSFLKNLYLKSLTPFEILDVKKQHKVTFDNNIDKSLIRLWKHTITKEGSDKAFEEYCSANGLQESDVLSMVSRLSDVEQPVQYPMWVHALERVIQSVEIKEGPDDRPFYELLHPFISYFESQFNVKTKKLELHFCNEDLMAQLKSALHLNLLNIGHQLFFEEFNNFKAVSETEPAHPASDDFYYKKFVNQILKDKYFTLFLKYPLLAKKITLKTCNFLTHITRLFDRLKQDQFEIEYKFDIQLKELKKLSINSGDQHNGEATAILEFDTVKIVYKPVNVGITEAYNLFLDWVNDNLGCGLKSFNVLNKKDYGWLEFIEHEPCRDKNDVETFYERAGILCGVAYFLNSNDYHYDNVIASGNCPVLIDHESIIGPVIQKTDKEGNPVEKIRLGNILDTLLLPPNNQNDPSYICGLGSSTQLETEIYTPKIIDVNKDSMSIRYEKRHTNLYKKNKPILNNKAENLADYQSEFRKGFEKIYNLVVSHKEFLLSEDSPLEKFKDQEVRFVYRPTEVYLKIMKKLNSTEFLSDSLKYGITLELLARCYAVSRSWSPVLDIERKQMLAGDVPVFYTNTLSEYITLPNGVVSDALSLTAFQSIQTKIKNSDSTDFNFQMKLINEVVEL
ncbi:type 2 lanthipeptide synthetase LanM [Chryseobacterium sp. JK1]|uniref:type 2 lanthipeptide synthetase LanM n=1 Tax=Chryseobacterium sp. JK1 TaxID=874294 RepID=UPI003D69F2DB